MVVKTKVGIVEDKLAKSQNEPSNVQLKRRIGLLEAVAVTVGSIIGSGIFVAPKGVVAHVGSVGASLVVWVSCGFLSLAGALCYAELGTTFPGSGGTYLYLKVAFGSIPAFLFLWVTIVITAPCGIAILSLTFAKYVTQTFFPIGTPLPETALTLIAACTVFALCYVNIYYARGAVKSQNLFMAAKVSALLVIIVAGIVYLSKGHVENYSKPWEDSNTNLGDISLAFYSGFFSYGGWSSLNFLTEEINEPNKNLPRALYISLPLVTCIYVMTNVAYFAVLSPQEMLLSDAIAVTFGQKLFGMVSWIMSLFVAISTCGALAITIMTSSRLVFAGARDGNFPPFLSSIKLSTLTPAPAIVFLGMLSLLYLVTSDIFLLITYCSYVDTLANLGVVAGLLYMRYRDTKIERPIKVCLIHPVIYLITCLFTAVLPILVAPIEVSVALIVGLTGLPIYFVLIARKHPPWLSNISGAITKTTEKIFMAVSPGD